MESINTASIRVVSSDNTESAIYHNHAVSVLREVGECPACDEFHKFYE